MKQLASNHGHTIVEIIIALGLVGLVSMGIFSLSQDTLKNIQSSKLSTTRDQLATQFRASAGRIKNLRLSLAKPENVDFYNCVCGKGSGCTSYKLYESLALYDDSDTERAIATYYDHSGIPCESSSAGSCTIQVKLSFRAQCKPTLPSADPSPPLNCVGVPVEFFAINYEILQNESSKISHGNLFKPVSGWVYTQVSTLVAGSPVCD